MKITFSFLIVLGLMISQSFANNISINDHTISGLSESQTAQLYANAAKMIEENNEALNVAKNVPTAQKLDEYAGLAKSISIGLADTAKNLGIAVNDFANSPVGRITEFVIVYKVIGNQIVHYFFGGVWFLVIGSVWWIIFRRTCLGNYEITYDKDTGKKITKTWIDAAYENTSTLGMRWSMTFLSFIIVIVGCLITFTG